MALFIVLAILVLVSALVIGFFSSMTTEAKSSRSYASGVSSKQLADSAVQLVVAQITDATKGKDGSSPLAWASQPGMIRTYTQSGTPAKYYKLYSSSTLVQDGTGFSLTTDAPPADWNSKQSLYTDLNSPVTRGSKVMFPILDGNSIKSLTVNEAGQSVPAYLTYDANNDGKPDVEGFSIDPASVTYSASQSPSPSNNPVPMPVKWLYILQNGKLAIPNNSSGGTVSFETTDPASTPSTGNPIVGRIAFWTDDETAKVNINTASEGTFWDRPYANTVTEQQVSTSIPGQSEFQRFPGHPAKTSLSTVFGSLLPSPVKSPAWYYGISSGQMTANQTQLKTYYDLTPRVSDGGTKGGMIANANSSFTAISPDSDRLYSSIDELHYNPNRTTNNSALDIAALERSKFFITARSRAPEINLFGKPRMTLWPLQLNEGLRNPKDKLIAFCSTIGDKAYYFQRYSAYSAGNPSGASSQSATLDWTGVPRNQQLYSYLSGLTSQPIPGFGGSFQGKYPSSREQILTQSFDQIRSGVNAYSTAMSPSYSYAPPYLSTGAGQVVPLKPPGGTPGSGTQGFGRFVTISGAAVNFFRTNRSYYTTVGGDGSANNPVKVDAAYIDDQSNPQGVIILPGAQLGAALILNPVTVSPGFPPWSPHVQYVITGLDSFKVNSASLELTGGYRSMGFPATPLKNTVTSRAEFSGKWNCSPFFGVIANLRYASSATTDAIKSIGFNDPVTEYPFYVPTPTMTGVQLAPTDRTFDFSGGTLTINVYSGTDAALSTPIQTITMNFPEVKGLRVPTTSDQAPIFAASTSFPPTTTARISMFGAATSVIAELPPSNTLQKAWHNMLIYYAPVNGVDSSYLRSYNRLGNGFDTNGNAVSYWIRNIARGVEANAAAPARGDYRVYAGLPNVNANYFTTSPGYDDMGPSGQKYANVQSLRDEGVDGGSNGGFGYDNAVPGGYAPHFPLTAGGGSNARNQIVFSPSTFPGVLLPKNLLAAYGGTAGRGSNPGDQQYRVPPAVPNGLTGAFMFNGNYGDWDNGTGLMQDGPYINKPDDGNSATISQPANLQTGNSETTITGGYFSFGSGDYISESGATFSPNRQVSSAIMFGSLPTGIAPSGSSIRPWQTLLFCPNPLANSSPGASAGTSHPGFGSPASGPPYTTPPDHLWLDLFTMPVVEPYAISEPFSTAGKVNMNYQIAPFSYLRRDTGVRAVLKATRITAIPQSASTVTAAANSYKDGVPSKYEFRYNINPDRTSGTLAGFEERFNKSDIFRSASEICSIFLVPELIPNLGASIPRLGTPAVYPPGSTPPSSYATTASWWNNFMLTGDNAREAPYGDIYPRLTTKSNTYTVHYKVQTLKKSTSTPANQWVDNKDQVTGEVRGSSTVERYIDLGNPNLPDFATDTAASAEDYYKIHIIASTTFSP
jgi:uncharacterized protein (TIGR02600 family)